MGCTVFIFFDRTIGWQGQTRFWRAEIRPYRVKPLDNTASILFGSFLVCPHLELRQNCLAPVSDEFSSDFCFLRCRRAGARQGEKDKKRRKGTLSGVFALVNRWYVWSFKLRRKTKNERKDHKGIDRDFFRYNICCNAACASDSGDIYTIAFILGAPYSEALCGFSAAYIQRPSI